MADNDQTELRIRRLLDAYLEARPNINMTLHDYITLVTVFTDVLGTDPSPIDDRSDSASMVRKPPIQAYCEVCQQIVDIPLGRHLWVKHRMKLTQYMETMGTPINDVPFPTGENNDETR